MRNSEPLRLPPLDLLLAFEAAARHLSFTRAGAERFVTQSAVSRQIRALEDELGVALFQRRHRALELTTDGQRLFAASSAMLAQLRTVVAEIRAPARREVLSLTTTPGLASLWLIPRLPRFTREHPGVDVRLDASFERRSLPAEGFDLAIRYGRVGATEGKPLFAEAMQPVCSPALLRSGPPLAEPADLRRHTLLQVSMPAQAGMPLEWAPWLSAVGLGELEPAASLTFSGYGEAIAAAVAGQGVALGRRPLVDGLLQSGQLVTPFADSTSSPRAYFLVVEPSARARTAVQALEGWLLAEAGATSAGPRPSSRPTARAGQRRAP
jgi:LysR family transcriptional regulator, glycine cleavage system transcriptional activator